MFIDFKENYYQAQEAQEDSTNSISAFLRCTDCYLHTMTIHKYYQSQETWQSILFPPSPSPAALIAVLCIN